MPIRRGAQLSGQPTDQDSERLDAAVLGFDPLTSPSAGMGIIAETFRTWPGTLRSAHPAVSVCAHGPDAGWYVGSHALAFACGPGTPLHALMDRPRMKLLLLGVGWNRASALHTAETLAQPRRLKTRRFLDLSGGERLWRETPDVADDGNRLFPDTGVAFEATGLCRRGSVGAAEARVCGYADLVHFAADWIGRANERSGDRA